jgi:hypothetical protein
MKKTLARTAAISVVLGCVCGVYWFRAQQHQIYVAAINSEVSNRFGPIRAPNKRLFFVRINGKDPPAGVLDTVSDRLTEFRPVSQAAPVPNSSRKLDSRGSGIFMDRETGEKGSLLDFTAIRWQLLNRDRSGNSSTSGMASISVCKQSQLHSLGASWIAFQLSHEDGRWRVTHREDGVSDWGW